MLVSFRIVNHRSLRDQQHLNLAPVYEADRPPGTEWPAVPVAAIYGANASGKSNVIDAFTQMREMVCFSDRDAEPGLEIQRSPFLLDADYARAPSSFDVDVQVNGTHYSYGFVIDDNGVIEEWLYRYPSKRRQVVFSRQDGKYRFGTTAKPDLREAVGITPENALFLSVAARAGKTELQPLYSWFREVAMAGYARPRATYRRRPFQVPVLLTLTEAADDPDTRGVLLELMRAADLGIADFGVAEVEFEDWPQQDKSDYLRRRGFSVGELPESLPTRRRVWFRMRGAKPGQTLALSDQSDGTRLFLERMMAILRVLETGSLFIADELEANLHPNLVAQIVRLFHDPAINRHGAQLIFTSHDTTLLGSNTETLKRDQVWFIEKDFTSGASTLFPLTDFKPRGTENTERRYRGGSYRAVPFIDDDQAHTALTSYFDRAARAHPAFAVTDE